MLTSSLTILFYFSRRRRLTRFSRDWSSDVCSSDLEIISVVSVLTVRLVAAYAPAAMATATATAMTVFGQREQMSTLVVNHGSRRCCGTSLPYRERKSVVQGTSVEYYGGRVLLRHES